MLNRIRIYLVGAIQDSKDYGVSWRNYVKDELKDTGILFFDPCDKPFIKDIKETKEAQVEVKKLLKNGFLKEF